MQVPTTATPTTDPLHHNTPAKVSPTVACSAPVILNHVFSHSAG
jgi:hypothetical protein